MRKAGYDDIPKNGLYVIGGLALQAGGHPLSELIEELLLSKQAAGQLVDTLVVRGYLERSVDEEDRRRLKIGLADRGQAAAKVLGAASAAVDAKDCSPSSDPEGSLPSAHGGRFSSLADIGRNSIAQESEDHGGRDGNGKHV